MHSSGFERTLSAPGRAPEIPESHDIYGWLIGSWELRAEYYAAVDLRAQNILGEAHFGRLLEGRAIQDTWIMPRRADRHPQLGITNDMYGTTLRVWEPAVQAWRITWINPVSGHRAEQIGRRIDDGIVQIGARSDGTPIRWRFTKSHPSRFSGSATLSSQTARAGSSKASSALRGSNRNRRSARASREIVRSPA